MNVPARILVVDDDPGVLEATAELLGRRGYTVTTASTAEDGIRLATLDRPDLVLMDYGMPGMDGRAAVQALKNDRGTRGIPVVALTGSFSWSAAELVRAGCVGYVPKPIDPREFVGLIEGFLKALQPSSRPQRGGGQGDHA